MYSVHFQTSINRELFAEMSSYQCEEMTQKTGRRCLNRTKSPPYCWVHNHYHQARVSEVASPPLPNSSPNQSFNVGSMIVSKIMSDSDIRNAQGKHYNSDYFSTLMKDSTDVYTDDGKLLFSFRKSCLAREQFSQVYKALSNYAKHAITSRRAMASGLAGQPVHSMVAGFFDEQHPRQKKISTIPCRLTAFSRDHLQVWSQQVQPLIQEVDNLYRSSLPKQYQCQTEFLSQVPEWSISPAFTTITANYNWQTAVHVDKGDFHDGISAIVVCERGKWNGAHLGYPQYGICVDVREGDILLMNPHEYHCNTELNLETLDAERLSIVIYAREKMVQCRKQ